MFTAARESLQSVFIDDSVAEKGDDRLRACKPPSEGFKAPFLPLVTDEQAAVRHTLMGQSSVLAVQQLGSPVCQLTNGAWRWLLDSGLSLDVQVADDGTINDVILTR